MHVKISQTVRDLFIRSWWMLKLAYGLLFIVAGADKFFNLVTHWQSYVNPQLLALIPLPHFMYLIGGIEIIIGLMILLCTTRIGAYAAALWFGLIIINLLTMYKYFDIAARDAVLAIGALVLAQLTMVKDDIEKKVSKHTTAE